MKTSLVILASVLLVLGMVGVAYAVDTASTTATVNVNERIDITIAPITGGVNFGSVGEGTTNNPVSGQGNGIPAVTVTNEATSNVAVDIALKGTDWSGPAAFTLANSNTRYDDDYQVVGDTGSLLITQLTTSYAEYFLNVAKGSPKQVWYWMNIPANQPAGVYTSTFSFQGTKA